MELREFVAETLKQIIDGTSAAQEHAATTGAIVNPRTVRQGDAKHALPHDHATGRSVQFVEFDVLVSAGESTERKGGLGIFVVGFAAGGQGASGTSSVASNHVKFSVGVCLPVNES